MHRAHSTFNIIHTRVTFLLQIRNTRYLPTANRPKLPILTPLTKSLPLVQQAATPWFTSHKPNSSGAFSGFSPHPHPPSSPTSNLISQPTTQHCHIQDKFFWEDKWSGLNSHDTVISSFSHSAVSDSLWPHESQHTRPLCPSPTPRVYSNPRPSSRWCHPAISSSVVPFSSCPNPSQHQGLFQWVNSSHEVTKSTGVSASASVLPMNTQDWSPLWLTGWISLQSKGSQESPPTPQFKSINSLALSFLHSPTLTSIHDHWKNHSLD